MELGVVELEGAALVALGVVAVGVVVCVVLCLALYLCFGLMRFLLPVPVSATSWTLPLVVDVMFRVEEGEVTGAVVLLLVELRGAVEVVGLVEGAVEVVGLVRGAVEVVGLVAGMAEVVDLVEGAVEGAVEVGAVRASGGEIVSFHPLAFRALH